MQILLPWYHWYMLLIASLNPTGFPSSIQFEFVMFEESLLLEIGVFGYVGTTIGPRNGLKGFQIFVAMIFDPQGESP